MLDGSSRIGWLGVSNYDADPHRFEVRVKRDGSVVHESSHAIRGGEDDVAPGTVVDCTWGDTAGAYAIGARIDGNEWVERSVDEAIDGAVDCVTVRVSYGDRSDELDIFARENCDDVPEYEGGCEFATE